MPQKILVVFPSTKESSVDGCERQRVTALRMHLDYIFSYPPTHSDLSTVAILTFFPRQYIHIDAHTYTHTYIHTHIHTYIHTHTHTHTTHIHIHTHKQTDTHTHTDSRRFSAAVRCPLSGDIVAIRVCWRSMASYVGAQVQGKRKTRVSQRWN